MKADARLRKLEQKHRPEVIPLAHTHVLDTTFGYEATDGELSEILDRQGVERAQREIYILILHSVEERGMIPPTYRYRLRP